jgi:hypothetical protein
MTLVRFNDRLSYLAKVQANAGTAETLSAADDACLPYIDDGGPAAPEKVDFVYDGAIGGGAAQLTPARRVAPQGAFRQGQFRCLPRGRGVTYSATVFPPNEIHRWLLASGYDATFGASPSARITYTPTAPDTLGAVLTVQQWAQGSVYAQRDVICNFSYEADGLGVPIFTFDWRGVMHTAPVDGNFPSITIDAATVQPPSAVAVVSALGSFTGHTLRRFSFTRNRAIDTARPSQTATCGHAGFVRGRFNPTMELEIERPARSAYDPEAIRAAASVASVSYQLNPGTQWNRFTHTMANAQLVDVTPGNDGNVPTITLVYEGRPSTPTANDAESLVWD